MVLSKSCWYMSCMVGSWFVTNWGCYAVDRLDVEGCPLLAEFWINLSKRIFQLMVLLSLICCPSSVCMYIWYFSRVSIILSLFMTCRIFKVSCMGPMDWLLSRCWAYLEFPLPYLYTKLYTSLQMYQTEHLHNEYSYQLTWFQRQAIRC